jgi:hypothetical protein
MLAPNNELVTRNETSVQSALVVPDYILPRFPLLANQLCGQIASLQQGLSDWGSLPAITAEFFVRTHGQLQKSIKSVGTRSILFAHF